MKLNRKTKTQIVRAAGHLVALIPLAILIWNVRTNNLGVDPVREILLFTGEWSLVFLVASLAVTPLKTVFGWTILFPLRRILGLYAFMYVAIHLGTFVWLDYGLNIAFIIQGIVEQNFVLVGFTAFLLLIPLAITSNKWSQRKLGKRWTKLHKLVFVIIGLALIHFWWLVKNVYYVPFLYTAVAVTLLLLRWQPLKQKVLRFQRRYRSRPLKKAKTIPVSEEPSS